MALQAMKLGVEDVFLAPARAFDGDDFTIPIAPLAYEGFYLPIPAFEDDEKLRIMERPSPELSTLHPKKTEEGSTRTFNTALHPKEECTSEVASNSEESFMTMRHPADQKKRKSGGLFDFLAGEQGREKRAKKKGNKEEQEYQLAESQDGVSMLVVKGKGCEDKERRDSVIGEDDNEG